jgi:hypothetical protein
LRRIDIPRNFSTGCVFLHFNTEQLLQNCLQEKVFELEGREISIKKALYG